MTHQIQGSEEFVHRVSSREDHAPLLSPTSETEGRHSSLSQLSCISCNICIKSKAAILILVWSVVMGSMYILLLTTIGTLGYGAQRSNIKKLIPFNDIIILAIIVMAYAFLALVLLLYPLSGYIADIYCGRYKTVATSLILMWLSFLMFCCAFTIGIAVSWNFWQFRLKYIPFGLLLSASLILMILSLPCYQANIIQLGLDQLLEAPSDKLGLFVHWLMWAHTLGSTIILLICVVFPCYIDSKSRNIRANLVNMVASVLFVYLFIITILLIFTCYKHSWFYSEPGQNNPYKIVFKVLNFARKNKYPLRRSAFTFCDDFRPSRIDFAKERYGGPFTTLQVEDVKTFFRVVLVLLTLGPVFVLDVPGSYYLFPLFALHIDNEIQFKRHHQCSSLSKWVLLQSGNFGYIISVVFFPFYIWIIFSLFRKSIPRILSRLWYAVFMPLVGIMCLLTTDLVGHYRYHQRFQKHSANNSCLFTTHFLYPTEEDVPTLLNVHWGALVPPSVLVNLGFLLIHATAFEFISAQSPHAMKGLLVGVFFAIKGLFQFISAAAVVPFAVPNIWNHINSVTNCAFGYYLFTIVVASIGLVVFSIVVKKYRYRQRDERPYDTRFAEEYYERYIGNIQDQLDSPSDDQDEQDITE